MRKEKPRKIGIILITLFIALSMILSIFAIVLDNQGNNLKYNNQKFTITDTGYKTKINDKFYTFQHFPSELERINLSKDTVDLIKNSQAIAIFFDPTASLDDLTYIDYSRFAFDEAIDVPVYFGVTQESDTYALPVISCANATFEMPFILINVSDDTGIKRDGNCIIMNAKLRETIALEERIVYQIFGIMK
ncbi:MAG: hypothetical protein ACP5NV_03220 [Candidatus Woesearchaeota archaeon]